MGALYQDWDAGHDFLRAIRLYGRQVADSADKPRVQQHNKQLLSLAKSLLESHLQHCLSLTKPGEWFESVSVHLILDKVKEMPLDKQEKLTTMDLLKIWEEVCPNRKNR